MKIKKKFYNPDYYTTTEIKKIEKRKRDLIEQYLILSSKYGKRAISKKDALCRIYEVKGHAKGRRFAARINLPISLAGCMVKLIEVKTHIADTTEDKK